MRAVVAKKSLTPQEDRLAQLLASGAELTQALTLISYTLDEHKARKRIAEPIFMRAVERHMRYALHAELAPFALATLRSIAADTTVLAATRRAAARDILDRAGWIPPKASAQTPLDQSIASMTIDELAALVDRTEQELADRATVINATDDASSGDDLSDLLD
jgi:hypothetical protein